MIRRLPASVCLLAFLCGASAAQEPGEAAHIRQWVEELAALEYEVRESARWNLCRAGRDALAAVEEASRSEDAEVRSRALEIVTYVSVGATPELVERVGRDPLRFPSLDRTAKDNLLRRIAERAGSEAVPFLRAVVETEHDPGVWGHAWADLRGRTPDDALPFLEALALAGRATAPGWQRLARTCSEARPSAPRETVLAFARVLLAGGAASDPEATLPWFELLLARGEDEEATRLLERIDLGENPLRRTVVARALLGRGRRDEAVRILEPLLAGEHARTAVGTLLEAGLTERAWTAAKEALEKAPSDGLRSGLFDLFLKALDLDHAAELATSPALERARLDETSCLARRREALERAGTERSLPALRDLVEECLWFGLGAEALAACRAREADLGRDPEFRRLALRAAVAALDFDLAATFLDEGASGSPDPEWERARFLVLLASGDRDRIGAAAAALDGPNQIPGRRDLLTAASAVTGAKYRMVDSNLLVERDGDAADALAALCRAAASNSKELTARDWIEVERRSRYLLRVEGTAEVAIARSAIRSLALQSQVAAMIFRLAGRWAEAERALPSPTSYDASGAFELARAAIERGRPEAAWPILEPFLGKKELWRGDVRVALRLGALAARASGDAPKSDALNAQLDRPELARPEYASAAGAWLVGQGMLEAAEPEWELALRLRPREGAARAPYELAFLHARRGDYGHAWPLLLRAFQASWVTRASIPAGRLHDPGPRDRALIEEWRALDALARGDSAEAASRFRRALAFDPTDGEAALRFAELVRATDPALAAGAGRIALLELQRRAVLAPLDPDAARGLALALEGTGRRDEALAWARKAVDLGGGEECRALCERLGRAGG